MIYSGRASLKKQLEYGFFDFVVRDLERFSEKCFAKQAFAVTKPQK